jgi:GTPase
MFVDRVTLYVRGGDGGNGAVSFRREKYAPRGGPNGGDGGKGGDVIVCAEEGLTNLAHLSHQRHWRGERGEHGQGSDCTGGGGDNLVIAVPPGTIVRDRDRGHVLRDLRAAGESVVVARGGRGGHGNTYFKSSTNRAPRQAEKGQAGEERWITLELKVIADVGLIGLPNAGKSTLLSRISRAHPEIADYPFTTKYPNLGTVNVGTDFAFVVADIPGLIEGAHEGHGLGHEFLRHVERTRLLVHLVEAVPIDGSDPLGNYRTIRQELERYSPALAARPELLVVTKMDLTGAEPARDRIGRELGREVMAISAVTGRGVPALIERIATLLRDLPAAEPAVSPQDAAARVSGG